MKPSPRVPLPPHHDVRARHAAALHRTPRMAVLRSKLTGEARPGAA